MFNTNVLNNLKLEAIQVFGSTTQQVYINRKQVKVVHAPKPATGKNDRLVKLRMMMTTRMRWVFKLMLTYLLVLFALERFIGSRVCYRVRIYLKIIPR